MDNTQGAGFAFDFDSNMDFGNLFATKPNEGNTSHGFFGDEGIDTVFSMNPQQTAFDMQSTLVS
jgi:hypothetical protein